MANGVLEEEIPCFGATAEGLLIEDDDVDGERVVDCSADVERRLGCGGLVGYDEQIDVAVGVGLAARVGAEQDNGARREPFGDLACHLSDPPHGYGL